MALTDQMNHLSSESSLSSPFNNNHHLHHLTHHHQQHPNRDPQFELHQQQQQHQQHHQVHPYDQQHQLLHQFEQNVVHQQTIWSETEDKLLHPQPESLSPLKRSKFFGDPCPFCLELMNCSCGSKAIVKLNPCKHQAHEICFREWIRSKNTCPYCRSVIDTYIHLSPNDDSSSDSAVYLKVNFLHSDGDSTVNDDLDLLNFSPLDYPWFPRWPGQGFKHRFRSMIQWFRPQQQRQHHHQQRQQQQQQQHQANTFSNAVHF